MKIFRELYNLLTNTFIIRKFSNYFLPNCLILYYHRVVSDKEFKKLAGPNLHLCVSEEQFKKQISFLKKNYEIIQISEIFNNKKKVNKPKICITFDDGYKDNLKIAFPIIKKYKIPITIYLISRFFKGDYWVWWFELSDILLKNKYLEFNFKGKNYNFLCSSNSKKNKVFFEIKNLIYKLNLNDQKKLIQVISKNKKRPQYKNLFLNLRDIKYMSNFSFVNFGSHGHDHLNYKFSSSSEILKYINYSKIALKKIFNKDINNFCYPYGSLKEVNLNSRKLVSLYFKDAVSTEQNICNKYDRIFLPRISIGPNINIRDFKSKIIGFEFIIKFFFSKIVCTK